MSDTLVTRYAGVVCDLDGVVYRGPAAVPGAVEALSAVESPVLYATNNASRPPADVAAHLEDLGLRCAPEQVATSSEAAAWVLGEHVPAGSAVLAVGGPGVATALAAAGFAPVLPAEASGRAVAAVVQGYGPGVTASDLGEAAYAIEGGARWVATNTDGTLPTDRGVAPGNGSLVAAVARAVGHEPHVVAGKPEAPLYLLCAERVGVEVSRLLAVGDRLDTDIEGAHRAGMDSLLVLTGVDDLDAVMAASAGRRPTFVAPDLRCLHLDPDDGDGGPSVGALSAAVAAVHSALDEGADEQGVELLRAVARQVHARGARG